MSPKTARVTFLPDTQRFAATIFLPRSTTASARPTWLYSSSVRACTASARDVVPGSAVLSMTLTRTPSRVSHRANTKPVGPAPTIRTSVLGVADEGIVSDQANRDIVKRSICEVGASVDYKALERFPDSTIA